MSSNSQLHPDLVRRKTLLESLHRPINSSAANNETYNRPFSQQELNHALSTASNSSPGPDTIPYAFLKELTPTMTDHLLSLYNRVWTQQSFPKQWRHAIVVPIAKPGKERSQPAAYRPISLTNCLCKIMERMVNARLSWIIEDRKLLSPTQAGSRKGHNTTDHLVRASSYIQDGFIKGLHTIGIFFDLFRAYDLTWTCVILDVLVSKWGLRGCLPTFIALFLQDRTIAVRCNSTISGTHPLENGIVQGSVLSGKLFTAAVNSISQYIPDEVLECIFMDDIGLFLRGKTLQEVQDTLQTVLQSFEQWSRDNGFQFSAEKTKVVHFCRKRKCPSQPVLHLNSQPLTVVQSHRFLGVVFDSRLTWRTHITQLRGQCMRALAPLRAVASFSWGADRATLLKLYMSLVRSKLDYGSIVYGSATPRLLQCLEPVQNDATHSHWCLPFHAHQQPPSGSKHTVAYTKAPTCSPHLLHETPKHA